MTKKINPLIADCISEDQSTYDIEMFCLESQCDTITSFSNKRVIITSY